MLFALKKSRVHRNIFVNAEIVFANLQKLMQIRTFELLVPKRILQATSILQSEAYMVERSVPQ
jgi:hypothetical protein